MSVGTLELVDTYAASRDRLHGMSTAAVLASIDRFDGWYSDALAVEISSELASLVWAGSRSAAGLNDVYLARAIAGFAGRAVMAHPVGIALAVGGTAVVAGGGYLTLRYGVPAGKDVYGRLVKHYRWKRSEGADDAEARASVKTRAEAMVDSDLSLAERVQTRWFMQQQDDNVIGYRRIIHPELAKEGSCGLCVAAADRLYHRKDLLPVHARCSCTVLPALHDRDSGQLLNRAALERLYGAVGDNTDGPNLKRVVVKTVEHGELGPMLVHGHHRTRTQQDVVRSLRQAPAPERAKNFDQEIAALEKTYEGLLARQAAGEDLSRPLEYQRDRLAKLRAQRDERAAA